MKVLLAMVLTALAMLLPACDRSLREQAPPELTVSAASSLQESFEALARRFEEEVGDARVRLNFGGSQALRLQIEHGARIDVFASANPQHVDALEQRRLVTAPATFARNDLVVIVPPDSTLSRFDELPQAQRIVLGAPQVPVGHYSDEILEKAVEVLSDTWVQQVRQNIVSREANVRLVVTRITLGEADAAIVYRTDALASGNRVRVVEIPEAINTEATYQITTVTDTGQPELARRFVAFVLGPTGQAIVQEHGFLTASQR
jgi:molybdate transport system substrate-binding protein